MYDVLRQLQPRLEAHAEPLLERYGLPPGGYLLLTIHRAANTDDAQAMRSIAAALAEVDLPVLFPVHPRTRNLLADYDISWAEHIQLVEPVGYLDMLTLQRFAHHVVTDSGGMQKEAFLLGVPCVTLREETEWPETLEGGWNVLVGSQPEAILAALAASTPMPLQHNPFGAGDAAERIADSLATWP
jgi:UDP-N-acetylglucosamine 2-epimerase